MVKFGNFYENKIEEDEIVGKEASSNPNIGLSILMGVSATIMLLGFLGCCGALTENRFSLFVFFVSLFVLLIMQVTAGILSFAFKSQIDFIFRDTMSKNVKLLESTDESAKHFQEILIAYQETYKCCGLVNGAVDWGSNFAENHKSCDCVNEADDCVNYGGRRVYRQICVSFVKQTIKDNLNIVIGLAFGMAMIEVQYDLAILTFHSRFCSLILANPYGLILKDQMGSGGPLVQQLCEKRNDLHL
ncbi:tetraspanin-8 [Sorex araneus]|uniref:tetraspanin-8 n=1 Tax=Sorex araneus TaxID=42254 RepID=UPI002433BC2D|nr:tetraspanin-8 [Sorex araneus]